MSTYATPTSMPGSPALAAAPASTAATASKNSKKKKKKQAGGSGAQPASNGASSAPQPVGNGESTSPQPTSSASATALTEEAESRAAVAAVDIVQATTSANPAAPAPAPASSPAERILTKRIKAVTKKLQRISQHEQLPPQQLNHDQKTAIASKPALQAVLKELQDVANAWSQAEAEQEAANDAQKQAEAAAAARDSQADADANMVLLQQILRLFTILHLPQVAPSFAPPNTPEWTATLTAQDVAAIGKLYEDVVRLQLHSSGENGDIAQAETEGQTVQATLRLVDQGSQEAQVLPGVSYARIKELLAHLVAPSEAQVPAEADPAPGGNLSKDEKRQDAEQQAAELIGDGGNGGDDGADGADKQVNGNSNGTGHDQAIASASARPAPVGGISFLQSSEVSRAASTEASVAGDEVQAPTSDEPVTQPEAEQEVVAVEAQVPEQAEAQTEPAAAPEPAQQPLPEPEAKKFDWAADVEGEDDLGDPLDAFPDQKRPEAAAAANGQHSKEEAPAQTQAEEPTPAAPAPAPVPATPSKKAPIVDEDGFVLARGKKSSHHAHGQSSQHQQHSQQHTPYHSQHQHQHSQQRPFRGGGPAGGGGSGGERGGYADRGARGNGGRGRGRGRGGGFAEGGRGRGRGRGGFAAGAGARPAE